ncbi:uncharacterized protein SOCE836_002160 [Sorangium cellulosum]|uniref:Uncharacterized protein n=1 Tax=Sorangium cellulosum TaxID=56 RepID=A0A4P2QFC8_SORCE|nr:uncharacterized protein SOCE836_002160 [Sorangium cellulosum]WCQ87552.1 hypothetical protein NQZ70_00215 [Sorangium sp. Soce836]
MYSVAVAWVRSDPRVRAPLSRSLRSDYRRIAALGDTWGGTLDALGGPYYLVRWVAGPGLRDVEERERRYRAACEALRREVPWTLAAWRALKAMERPLRPAPPRHRLRSLAAPHEVGAHSRLDRDAG